jgi:hypothetical protein
MGPRPPKKAEEPKYGGDETRTQATSPVMPLANPLDKSYLCGKSCVALVDPLQNRLGHPMYQRTVTRSIWADNRLAKQYWRYKGEVGYDMTKNPQAPIMSASEQTRPSTFPLAALHSINKADQAAEEAAADASGDPLSRQELEAAGGKRLRIPDVIVLNCSAELLDKLKGGNADIRNFIPVQKNIERIVEVKFDGDTLTEPQRRAYATIAGSAEFNLLQPEHSDPDVGCKCRERRKQSRRVPVVVPEKAPARKPDMRQVPATPTPSPYPVGARPLGEALQNTPTTTVSGWAVVLTVGIVAIAILGAPETGGGSLALLAL